MSEQTTPTVNETLTKRVNEAYIAKDFTLLNGGTDNILMMQGKRDGKDPVDILMTYQDLKEVLTNLAPATIKSEEGEQEKPSQQQEQPAQPE